MTNPNRRISSNKRCSPQTITQRLELIYFKLLVWAISLGICYKLMECFLVYEAAYPVWSKIVLVAICLPIAFLCDWLEKKLEIWFHSRLCKTL